jgi:hypothetical protein
MAVQIRIVFERFYQESLTNLVLKMLILGLGKTSAIILKQ